MNPKIICDRSIKSLKVVDVVKNRLAAFITGRVVISYAEAPPPLPPPWFPEHFKNRFVDEKLRKLIASC